MFAGYYVYAPHPHTALTTHQQPRSQISHWILLRASQRVDTLVSCWVQLVCLRDGFLYILRIFNLISKISGLSMHEMKCFPRVLGNKKAVVVVFSYVFCNTFWFHLCFPFLFAVSRFSWRMHLTVRQLCKYVIGSTIPLLV